jgi:hypothetical protein
MRNTILKQVEIAFKLLGDLKTDITFEANEESPSFDFNSGEVSVPDTVTLNLSAILLNVKKEDESGAIWKKLILKNADLPDLSFYDKVTIGENVHSIHKPIQDNGYITTIEIYSK